MLVLFIDYKSDSDENFEWITVALYNPTNNSLCTEKHHYKRREKLAEDEEDPWNAFVMWLMLLNNNNPSKLWITCVLGNTALFQFERAFRQHDPSGLSLQDHLTRCTEIGYLDHIAWFSGLSKFALEEKDAEQVSRHFVKTLAKTKEIEIVSSSKDGIYNRVYYHMSLFHSALEKTTTASKSNSYLSCLPATSSSNNNSTPSDNKDCIIS